MIKKILKNNLLGLLFMCPIIIAMEDINEQRLYDEVQEIMRQGKTVKEAELERLQELRIKSLSDLKSCFTISDEFWNEFLRKLQICKSTNPLFSKVNDPINKEISPCRNRVKYWLKKRNLNPDTVKVKFSIIYYASQGITINDKGVCKFSNTLFLPFRHLPRVHGDRDKSINHELTHLEESHSVEKLFLINELGINFESGQCQQSIKNYNHIIELQADLKAAGIEEKIAKEQQKSFCHNLLLDNNDESVSHPSPKVRCNQANRYLQMLEIEKRLLAEKMYEKQYRTFDPVLNG